MLLPRLKVFWFCRRDGKTILKSGQELCQLNWGSWKQDKVERGCCEVICDTQQPSKVMGIRRNYKILSVRHRWCPCALSKSLPLAPFSPMTLNTFNQYCRLMSEISKSKLILSKIIFFVCKKTPKNMHIFNMLLIVLQSFKMNAWKPWEELTTQSYYLILKPDLKIV